MVISMRLPAASGQRLKRMAHRHGWTASDASARLVEEGLRRTFEWYKTTQQAKVAAQATTPAAAPTK